MPELRTDDEIRRAARNLRYLGPNGWTLPIRLTFSQWAVYAGFTLPAGFGALLLLGPSWIGMGAAVGIGVGFAVTRHMDHDRPARSVLRTALTDWRSNPAPDPTKPAQPIRFTTRHLTDEGGDDQ
jgi:hypothetical protein